MSYGRAKQFLKNFQILSMIDNFIKKLHLKNEKFYY